MGGVRLRSTSTRRIPTTSMRAIPSNAIANDPVAESTATRRRTCSRTLTWLFPRARQRQGSRTRRGRRGERRGVTQTVAQIASAEDAKYQSRFDAEATPRWQTLALSVCAFSGPRNLIFRRTAWDLQM